jgi:hypothetical protein
VLNLIINVLKEKEELKAGRTLMITANKKGGLLEIESVLEWDKYWVGHEVLIFGEGGRINREYYYVWRGFYAVDL